MSGCSPWRGAAEEQIVRAVVAGDMPTVRRLLARRPGLANTVVSDVMCRDSVLHMAVTNRRYAVAELLIKSGADINYLDFSHRSPLHNAVELGDVRMVRVLMRHKARVQTRDCIGSTPLHSAAVLKSPQIAQMLLKAGADPTARADDDTTPLDEAVRHGRYDTAELLKSHLRSSHSR